MSETLKQPKEIEDKETLIYNGVVYLSMSPPWLLKQVESFALHTGDLVFGTYPRSGTPLLSEIIWLIHNKADVAAAKITPHGNRIRFMEHLVEGLDPLEILRSQASRRLLKTHLPADFFQRQASTSGVRYLILLRNPKDMLVSFFKFYQNKKGYINFSGDWNDFFELFKGKKLVGGDWFDHTSSWCHLKHDCTVKFIWYEDVLTEPIREISKISEFCHQHVSAIEVNKICDYVKEIPEETKIRNWRNYFDDEQCIFIDKLYQRLAADYPDYFAFHRC